MTRLGLFGGAFNPVHEGHLAVARAAREALDLDAVLFIPSGTPPLKGDAGLAPGDDRLAMIRQAIAGKPGFAVSDIEIRRAGRSFAVDTVRALRAELPHHEMVFLLGADCAPRLHHWKGIDELRRLVRFVILTRAGDGAPDSEPQLQRVATPSIPLSSTLLRERIAQGRPIDGLTPPAVAAYIAEHGLYRQASVRERIERVLLDIRPRVIACSGGIDSLLLATLAHRLAPEATIVAHAISPAVPAEATRRVKAWAAQEGWTLRLVRSGEFADERYLSNPVNRCYFCKSNLYAALTDIAAGLERDFTLLSGANLDDLGEYRPGLDAAREVGVRHPWIEAQLGKADIRAVARELGLPFAALPASPCLASRLYTGTRVTAERLAAVEAGETLIRARTGIEVVRCRIREDELVVETPAADRRRISADLIEAVLAEARKVLPQLTGARLDAEAYRPGRAFVGAPT
jgi:uncharacterized protein